MQVAQGSESVTLSFQQVNELLQQSKRVTPIPHQGVPSPIRPWQLPDRFRLAEIVQVRIEYEDLRKSKDSKHQAIKAQSKEL